MHLIFIKGSCHIQIKSLEHSAFTTVVHQKHQGCVMAILREQGVNCYRNHYCLHTVTCFVLDTTVPLWAAGCFQPLCPALPSLPSLTVLWHLRLCSPGTELHRLTSWPSPPCSPSPQCQRISLLSLPSLPPSPPYSHLYWCPFSPPASSPLSCSLFSRALL